MSRQIIRITISYKTYAMYTSSRGGAAHAPMPPAAPSISAAPPGSSCSLSMEFYDLTHPASNGGGGAGFAFAADTVSDADLAAITAAIENEEPAAIGSTKFDDRADVHHRLGGVNAAIAASTKTHDCAISDSGAAASGGAASRRTASAFGSSAASHRMDMKAAIAAVAVSTSQKSVAMVPAHRVTMPQGEWVDADYCQHCQDPFIFLYRRKHHCRYCGDCFCNDCAPTRDVGSEKQLHCCDRCWWSQFNRRAQQR